MDPPQSGNSGFDPNVWEQLNNISSNTHNNGRRRGGNRRGRTRALHHGHVWEQGHGYGQHSDLNVQQPHAQWHDSTAYPGADLAVYPPIGSLEPARQSIASTGPVQPQLPYHAYQSRSRGSTQNSSQPNARDFFERARGGSYRGTQQSRPNYNRQHMQKSQQATSNPNDFHRPPPQHSPGLYVPGNNHYLATSEQQKVQRHRIIAQSDYLSFLASQHVKNSVSVEEAQQKESFRRVMQNIAQRVLRNTHTSHNINIDSVKLRLYGSLGSGFAITGCDMDLLLVFPQGQDEVGEVEIESRRMLEKALLDEGYGARLLTQTRVPILKVCQKPSTQLLHDLREHRAKWDQDQLDKRDTTIEESGGSNFEILPTLTDNQREAAELAFGKLSMDAAEIPLPPSPSPDTAKLEFSGDHGIQCDINFSNYVALHNTELLRIYGHCDPRVRQMGLFVKNWAKTRDINTPYRGTLSSYGYILMVLHYLMNVVKPPLIPNLQSIAKEQDAWANNPQLELVEGHDVRFVRDPQHVQQIVSGMARNHESLGSLLRGFFWYFAAAQGFNWTHNALSLRTPGGLLTKRQKDWTGAKWAGENNRVRLRYLIAIEDPFEIEHNVGRTVGHSGIVAIRDEFRRAWAMIDNVHFDQSTQSWFWSREGNQMSAMGFMDVAKDRGDLLRKDHDAHKEKMRQMRRELEAQEHASKGDRAIDAISTDSFEKNGMSNRGSTSPADIAGSFSNNCWNSELIHDRFQDNKRTWKGHTSRRLVLDDGPEDGLEDGPEDEPDINEGWPAHTSVTPSIWNSEWRPHTDDNWQEHEPMWSTHASSDTQPAGETQSIDNTQTTDNTSMLSEHPNDLPGTDIECASTQDGSEIRAALVSDRDFARNGRANIHLAAHNRGHRTDEKVGTRIPWDQLTKAGRWLRWRDCQIRSDRWKPPSTPMLRILSNNFAYDPKMSYSELAQLNLLLRNHYSFTLYPSPPLQRNAFSKQASRDIVVEAIKTRDVNDIPVSAYSTPKEMETMSQQSPTGLTLPSNSLKQSHEIGQKSATDDQITPPSLKELRAARVRYFQSPNETSKPAANTSSLSAATAATTAASRVQPDEKKHHAMHLCTPPPSPADRRAPWKNQTFKHLGDAAAVAAGTTTATSKEVGEVRHHKEVLLKLLNFRGEEAASETGSK